MTAIFNGIFAKLKARAMILGMGAGNRTLSAKEFTDGKAFFVTGVTGPDAAITVPAVDRAAFWGADPENSDPVAIRCGSASKSIEPGQWVALATDGTANGIDASGLTGSVSTTAWQVVTGDFEAQAADRLEFTLTAPARLDLPEDPTDLDSITIRNLDGSFGAHTLTIDGNGMQIGSPQGGYTDELTVGLAYVEMVLVAFGGKWRVLV